MPQRKARVRSAVLAVLWFTTAAFAQDASMFRGNLAHTGVYAAIGAPKLTGVKSVRGANFRSPLHVN
jgi:hypothetical protein